MTFGHSLILATLVAGTHAFAQETKTTYSISGSNATVTTVVKKASADKEKLMRSYLFEKIAEKLKAFPMVTGVEFNKETKGEISSSSYSDYWELKRSYPAMIHLSLPTSVTMMVRVEESYRKCKSPAEKAASISTPMGGRDYDDYSGYGGFASEQTVDCTLQSSVKIRGPVAVYGNFASSMNVERLLKEKQSISYEVSRDWLDKTSMKIEGRFSIESELFDRNLFKFLDAFNLKVSDSESKVMTRNNLLLGIARVLRVNNERVVE
jgi:hypothetical protein